MAIVIFREGESKRIDNKSLSAFLRQGWTTKDPNPKIRPNKTPRSMDFPTHIGHLDIPPDATPLEAQEIVLGKMNIRV